jgi:hypothetical protein
MREAHPGATSAFDCLAIPHFALLMRATCLSLACENIRRAGNDLRRRRKLHQVQINGLR